MGYVGTHNTNSAAEHADAASEWQSVELQSAEWRSVATEHADDPDDALKSVVPSKGSLESFTRKHPDTLMKSRTGRAEWCGDRTLADTSTCYRAVQFHEVVPNPMTFKAAMQIPMKDTIGKGAAWRQLSQRDDVLIDVTEHGTFKWLLFLSNLGPNTKKVFGSGKMFGLRTEHTDSAVQWIISVDG